MNRQYPVIIVEEPQSRGFRFRYECEGPSHGGLQGQRSERGRKSYPSIRIEGHSGPARIEVSLVTEDKSKNHPHKLVGKNCEDGVCVMEVRETFSNIQFQNMSVQHVTRRKAVEVLQERIRNKKIRDKKLSLGNIHANVNNTAEEELEIEKLAKDQAKSTQLNVVRLCIQVYIQANNGQLIMPLLPVYSQPIYDSKAPGASTLKICRMDKYGGCCTGNDEVFLLCEKVQKDDIAVKFFEPDLNRSGEIQWESYGNFGPLDVHRQFAIVFKTPAYHNTKIDKAVNVFIVLERKSDKEQSDPKAFTYYPQNLDKDEIQRKRRKRIPEYVPSFSGSDGSHGSAGAGGGNGVGGSGFTSGGGIRENYGIVLPNGNVLTNQAVLPTTVLQAVRDEYESSSNSSFSSYSPYINDYSSDPMYSSTLLETDSEPIYSTELVTFDEIDGRLSGISLTKETCLEASPITTEIKSLLVCRGSKPTEQIEDICTTTIEKEKTPLKTKVLDDETTPKTDVKRSESTSKEESLKIIERTLTAMQDYAETSDIRYLLLVQRHLASVQNNNGDLPIHLAVINEQLPALHSLLGVMATLPNASFKVNSFNYLRQTAFHLAVITKQHSAIELLLHYGADPAFLDRLGNTPANLAVQNNCIPCLQSLLKYLRPGVTAKCPFPELNYMNYEGYCPAHIAAQNGSVDILRMLYFGQANLDLADGKSGRTPLHHAVEADDLSVASYLLMEAETDVNAQCFDGNTPLHIACGRNLVAMVALLITAGADINIENEESNDEGYDSETSDSKLNDTGPKVGLKPADCVCNNEQILRILHGDISSNSDSNSDLETDSADISTSIESGLGSNTPLSVKGDLETLDYNIRLQLSSLLDPQCTGKDVFSLADVLGLSDLRNALEDIKASNTSPTRFLLDYFETSDGTVAKLKSGLQELKRTDAASLLS